MKWAFVKRKFSSYVLFHLFKKNDRIGFNQIFNSREQSESRSLLARDFLCANHSEIEPIQPWVNQKSQDTMEEKFRDLLGKVHRNPSSKRKLFIVWVSIALRNMLSVFSPRSACCYQETAVTCMAIWDMPDFLIPLGAGQHLTPTTPHCTKPSEDSKYTFHAVNHFSCASLQGCSRERGK